jgi:hypothetical protein
MTMFEDRPEYVHAIGLATAEMAVVENLLGQLLAKVLGIGLKIGQTIYLSSHTAFGRLATLDITAAAVLPAKELEKVKAVTKRARELLQRHNDMPQDIWKAAEGAGLSAHLEKLNRQVEDLRALGDELKEMVR